MNWPDCINTVVHGDALAVLRQMLDRVIQTCITSPPYWGLRDYRIEDQLGRQWVGIELSQEYIDIAKQRLCQNELF